MTLIIILILWPFVALIVGIAVGKVIQFGMDHDQRDRGSVTTGDRRDEAAA